MIHKGNIKKNKNRVNKKLSKEKVKYIKESEIRNTHTHRWMS